MCDTMVALGKATKDGVTLFAKNSDREPNEAQLVEWIPPEDHSPGSTVKCTYIEIPQVEHTHGVLLSRPFWMWGAEMGVNEHGLAIGNEAVFTKIPYEKKGGLLGMDMLRLALERAETAREGVEVITNLLAEFGQGGNCGFQKRFYYHNSFLLADPHDAWVLETAGPHWAAKQIDTVYSISNGLTIGSEWDLASEDLVRYAVRKGWCKGKRDFHFAKCYSDMLYTHFSACRARREKTAHQLTSEMGKLSPSLMMQLLRSHGEWQRLDQKLTGSTVCMHAGFGPVRGSQTVGSLVSYLEPVQPLHFVTGTAAPCTSVFKPVWMDAGLPELGPKPNGMFDPKTLFWHHELLHRKTLQDYATYLPVYDAERANLEEQFLSDALKNRLSEKDKRAALTSHCFAQAREAEERWLEKLKERSCQNRSNLLYQMAWKRFNKMARMPKV